MAGLTISGFVPETLSEIKERIKGKLELINPGFDFSPESPDGQLIEIMSFEIWQAWTQLDLVYNSFNPAFATGAALRNIGLITGIPYGTANRSYVTVELQGTAGTVVPANSLVTDDMGNEFYLASAATVPNNAQAICRVPGPVVVTSGTVVNIKTPVTGWSGITQTTEGVIGSLAMQDQEYRNLRTSTIMRNYTSTVETMRGRLIELGVGQATVFNNDSNSVVDTVPANTVAVTIGDQGTVSDESVATVIFETNAVGCPTFGTTTVSIEDQQGFSHDINYTKATAVPMSIVVDVKFPTIDTAGAEESIKSALLGYINGLPAGSDVIWSRLFQYITPFAEAEVVSLTVGKLSGAQGTVNVVLTDIEYASLAEIDIIYSATIPS